MRRTNVVVGALESVAGGMGRKPPHLRALGGANAVGTIVAMQWPKPRITGRYS